MTNFGLGYVLAALPRRANARQVRVLAALETFRCDQDGWRSVSQVTLAAYANVDLKTLKRARAELLDKKLIEYRPGQWKGVLSRYRICVPPLDEGSPGEPLRGSTVDPLTRNGKGGQHRAQRGSITRPKGVNRKPGKHAAGAGHVPDFAANGRTPALSAEAEALLKLSASAAETVAASPNGQATDLRPRCDACGKPTSERRLIRYSDLSGRPRTRCFECTQTTECNGDRHPDCPGLVDDRVYCICACHYQARQQRIAGAFKNAGFDYGRTEP